MLKVACLQINSSSDQQRNIDQVIEYTKEAAKMQVDLLCLPENAFCMPRSNKQMVLVAEKYRTSSTINQLRKVALSNAIDILIGSLPILDSKLGKLKNRSIYIDKFAKVLGFYDKIHLFKAKLKNGEVYNEAKNFTAGVCPKIINSRFGKLGMSVCFDLRFPNLYRYYAQKGVALITIPAAFTYTTGKMHWHVLLRARAIETGCFILAPAQCGIHDSGRRTYGHSLIVSPLGEVIAEGSENREELITAKIDIKLVSYTRNMIPCLKNSRIDSK